MRALPGPPLVVDGQSCEGVWALAGGGGDFSRLTYKHALLHPPPSLHPQAALWALDEDDPSLRPPPNTDGTPPESAQDVLVRGMQVGTWEEKVVAPYLKKRATARHAESARRTCS